MQQERRIEFAEIDSIKREVFNGATDWNKQIMEYEMEWGIILSLVLNVLGTIKI